MAKQREKNKTTSNSSNAKAFYQAKKCYEAIDNRQKKRTNERKNKSKVKQKRKQQSNREEGQSTKRKETDGKNKTIKKN